MVEGFMGTPKYPMRPAVITKGNRLGTNETTIILKERNMYAINKEISKMAKDKEMAKFLTRYLVPF